MPEVIVNLVAVFVAAIASMVVGFIWYSPMLFGKPWMELMGYGSKNMEQMKKGVMKMYALSFIGSLVMAYVLFHSYVFANAFFGIDKFTAGLMTGFWSWLGFVAPVQYTEVMFGGKSNKLFLINTGYQLVSLLIMGAIIAIL
ncbi:MAG: DUF1761 domain-containing protein [Candidatus Diapherotrites archaeon]|nr:DUF1761 domain-containing protein [Candidatus Diapherotrites archaeon]